MREKILPILLLSSITVIPGQALAAGTLTGDIGVKLVIGEGCTVSNSTTSGSGINRWGELDFGTQADLSNSVDASIAGSASTGSVTVRCSAGLSPALTLGGGLYSSGALRSVSSDGGTTKIPYRLYSDSARTNEITIGGSVQITADGTAQDIPVYGRILPGDQSSTSPAAGTYTDTVVATLFW
ncbi:spore coat U domain-containing protein [Dickeya fangzhongdai]|uniref:Csu type fimbrial protein n=1 Tax=Dickeya fangzhongdai TaxID=1778540 RepID=UPI002B3032AF|nr:spore coat U domain-containing protein [Dickeya fangzhongdai]